MNRKTHRDVYIGAGLLLVSAAFLIYGWTSIAARDAKILPCFLLAVMCVLSASIIVKGVRATKEAENGEVSVQTEEKPASAAEVVTEEPTYEESSYEEPSYEEPSYEEPSYEEPSYEEPAAPETPDNGGQEGCVNGALFN